ncbi:Alpha/Beta hydrolase protein [Pterulicium gracile]|uniref:Carboxylic ester hydrolase n=1 Tax=Pterulicium gracile TaxID=1884261 RepID=A0A5C3Q0I0_9AGAR|nr:Alpha/Beta hydrolase protein [Pterula gracilis]
MFSKTLLTTFVFLASTTQLAFGSPITAPTLESRTLREDLIVTLPEAKYQGTYNAATGIVEFLGIRYGKSPTGALRFAAAQPPSSISPPPLVAANKQPNACIQSDYGAAASNPYVGSGVASAFTSRAENLQIRADAPQSEDCLFMNVHVPYTPNVDPGALPVVMWFHGGGYAMGSASMYDGSLLTKASSNKVITITVQYRLGLFGFLAGEETKKNGQPNAGLMDQELAMKWVHEYVRAFGGDPHKMTIWGQSAGAGSVLHHAVSRDGKTQRSDTSTDPYYNAAIASSPFTPPQYKHNDPIPTQLYNLVASQAGCTGTGSFACLRSATTAKLTTVNAAIAKAGFGGQYAFVPVIDGTFLTQTIAKGLKKGTTIGASFNHFEHLDKALMTVSNVDEGLIFINPAITLTAAEYAKQLFPNLTAAQQTQIQTAYASFPNAFARASAIMGESHIVCPSLWAATSFATANKPTFKAKFAIAPAVHLQDVSYYFNGLVINPQIPPPFSAAKFQTTFAQSFLSFAVSQDPNNKLDAPNSLLPSWTKYTTSSLKEEVFGQKDATTGDIKMADVDAAVRTRCQMWDSLLDVTAV